MHVQGLAFLVFGEDGRAHGHPLLPIGPLRCPGPLLRPVIDPREQVAEPAAQQVLCRAPEEDRSGSVRLDDLSLWVREDERLGDGLYQAVPALGHPFASLELRMPLAGELVGGLEGAGEGFALRCSLVASLRRCVPTPSAVVLPYRQRMSLWTDLFLF